MPTKKDSEIRQVPLTRGQFLDSILNSYNINSDRGMIMDSGMVIFVGIVGLVIVVAVVVSAVTSVLSAIAGEVEDEED